MYNKLLGQKVIELNIKKAVTTVSTDLGLSKGMISSYLGGKILASEKFLKLFSNFYNVPLEDITDPEENQAQKNPLKAGMIVENDAVDYLINNADRLRKDNLTFKMFCDLLVAKAELDIMKRLRDNT